MFKKQFKLLVKNSVNELNDFEIINTRVASSVKGGCRVLESCHTFEGTCPSLKTCENFTETNQF